ncbi:MAG: RNA polymerase sigma factor [Chlorobi bacterium]|nr:RNA polymerase sigma factor [Chlorobiota bacterium]
MAKDTGKFTELLKPHYNDAMRYSRALCAGWSPDEAEDVLQQSFLIALENFENLNDISKFRSWFFKIITTTFYSAVRKHFWKKFLPMDSGVNIPKMPQVFNCAEQTESRIILNQALSKLSAKERSAILLFEIAGFSIEEITRIQKEKSTSAVKSRLSRARAKLRKYITEQENFLPRNESQNGSNGEFKGDLENETIKLISEIRTDEQR